MTFSDNTVKTMDNKQRVLEETAIRTVYRNRWWMVSSKFTWLCLFLDYTLLSYGGEVW